MTKIKQICEEKLSSEIENLGFELVDVEYVKEGGGMSLIFTIDGEHGVTVDDCEVVSKKIDPLLDEINPTDDKPYTLVVSSPGLDKPLQTERQLKRHLGEEVEITLFAKQDGVKNFVGKLKDFDEKTVTLSDVKITNKKGKQEPCESKTFEREKIGSIKLVINI